MHLFSYNKSRLCFVFLNALISETTSRIIKNILTFHSLFIEEGYIADYLTLCYDPIGANGWKTLFKLTSGWNRGAQIVLNISSLLYADGRA